MRNYQFQNKAIKRFNPDAKYTLRDWLTLARTCTFKRIEDVLPDGAGKCIDLGCGDGRHRPAIEAAGYTWTGLDISTKHKLQSQYICGNTLELPLKSNAYDLVVCWQMLEHVPQPNLAIVEMARTLKGSGCHHWRSLLS